MPGRKFYKKVSRKGARKDKVTAEAQRTRRNAEEVVSAFLRVLCASAVTLVFA